MSDNWVVQNLENALETWNDKLSEIWQLLTTTPQDFKGGSIWNVMVTINGAVQAIGLALLVLFFVGGVVGYAFGRFAVWLINRINLSNSSLYPILLLSLVFATFTITDLLKGNGYLAVYITGILVGNSRLAFRKEINTFMDGLTWLFQIIMFLLSDSGPPGAACQIPLICIGVVYRILPGYTSVQISFARFSANFHRL